MPSRCWKLLGFSLAMHLLDLQACMLTINDEAMAAAQGDFCSRAFLR